MNDLQDRLVALHHEFRKTFKAKWRRSIPFYEEFLGDRARWERAQFLGFDDGTNLYESSYVYGDVKVGKGTWIGPFTILDGTGGLEIGDYCSISTGVQIYSHETVEWALTGGKAKYKYMPTRIGNCCFVGSLSVVRMGITIGDRVMIGAHSFVNSNIPSNSIASGCPARVIGEIDVKDGEVKLSYHTSRMGSDQESSEYR